MFPRIKFVAPVLAILAILAACEDEQPDDGLTQPGAHLSFGEAALVDRSDGAGRMSLTVEEIDQGDPADLAFGDTDIDGQTPYYVRVEVTPETGDTSFNLKNYLNVFAGEEALDHLSVFVEFEPCQEVPISSEPIGETQESCLVFLTDEAAPAPDAVYFDNDENFAAADGNAVKWE